MPLGLDPLVNFKFWVVIDGITVAQFRECDGLSISVKVIEHRSPGVSGAAPLLRRGDFAIEIQDGSDAMLLEARAGRVADVGDQSDRLDPDGEALAHFAFQAHGVGER